MNNQTQDTRTTLKQEILTLTDRQADYVLLRLRQMLDNFAAGNAAVPS